MSKTLSKQAGMSTTWAAYDWLRITGIVLCIAGILVAGYLAWAEVTGNETQCADVGKLDCSAVQNSAYAKVFGFPIAVLGLMGYVAILGVMVLEDQIEILATYGRTLNLGFALFGVIFSVYLSLIEATVLDAWCQWCVASAILITALLVIAAYRVYLFLQPLRS